MLSMSTGMSRIWRPHEVRYIKIKLQLTSGDNRSSLMSHPVTSITSQVLSDVVEPCSGYQLVIKIVCLIVPAVADGTFNNFQHSRARQIRPVFSTEKNLTLEMSTQ